MNKTLITLFNESCKKYACRQAYSMYYRYRHLSWTYAELDNVAAHIAADLLHRGIEPGDRVLLLASNSPFWVAAFFGILRRGAVVVPLNTKSTREFVEKVATETDAKLILLSSDIKLGGFDELPVVHIDTFTSFTSHGAEYKPVEVAPDDLAEIVYTSGTTGAPKGVMLTHANIIANVEAIAKIVKPEPGDAIVSVMPLFHMLEQAPTVFMAVYYGVPVMFSPSVTSRHISETLKARRPTKIVLVPELLETIIRKMETKAEETGRKQFLEKLFKLAEHLPFWLRRIIFRRAIKQLGGRITFIVSGGAPLAEDVQKKWLAMGVYLLQAYGLTETSPVLTANTPENWRVLSVGRPLFNVELKIEEDGEICARGPNVFPGYYKDEARTKACFDEEGFFHTGDLGYLDEDGFLYINGRKKYMIVSSSGENIYPEDLEFVLKNIEGVIDAAVLGLEKNGREVVHACLLGNFEDPAAVVHAANQKLASHQRIVDWSVWPEADFPRSATRKVRKEEVRKWLVSQGEVQEEKTEQHTPLERVVSSITGVSLKHVTPKSILTKDLLLDSLMRIELVARVEEDMGVMLDESKITSYTTVADLEKMLTETEPPKKQRGARYWLTWWPLRYLRDLLQILLIFPLYRIWMTIKPQGLEHLDEVKGPVIFMANHLTYADTVVVFAALPWKWRRKLAVAAALDFLYGEYPWISVLLEFFFTCYPFPRKEHENIKAGLEATGKFIDKGYSILVFPEGKISRTGTMLPLKRGAGLLATNMAVPIAPVCISGINKVLQPEKVIPSRTGVVTVKFGKPLHFTYADSYIEATEKIEGAMRLLHQNLHRRR